MRKWQKLSVIVRRKLIASSASGAKFISSPSEERQISHKFCDQCIVVDDSMRASFFVELAFLAMGILTETPQLPVEQSHVYVTITFLPTEIFCGRSHCGSPLKIACRQNDNTLFLSEVAKAAMDELCNAPPAWHIRLQACSSWTPVGLHSKLLNCDCLLDCSHRYFWYVASRKLSVLQSSAPSPLRSCSHFM